MWRVMLTDGNLSWWSSATPVFQQNDQFLMGQDGRTVYWRHSTELAGTLTFVPDLY